MPEPALGGHVPPDLVAHFDAIHANLADIEENLQQLLVELRGIRDEQLTQANQRILLHRIAAALATAAADPVPHSEAQ